MSAATINVYRSAGEWCYALWIDGEYDTSGVLDCKDDANEREAMACAEAMPLRGATTRTVRRTEDA